MPYDLKKTAKSLLVFINGFHYFQNGPFFFFFFYTLQLKIVEYLNASQ